MSEKRIKAFILCRNGLLREFLARILSKKPDIEILPESAGNKSIEELANLGVDVLVLDSLEILMEQGFCPSAQRSTMKFLAISMEEDMKEFLLAIQHGVSGYVLREASALEVITAIREVAQGRAVCPASLTRGLFDFVVSQAPGLPNSRSRERFELTNREQQLIPLLSRGLTNKEIAAELQLSEQTVKNHVHRILRKVGVDDRLSVFEAYQTKSLGLNY